MFSERSGEAQQGVAGVPGARSPAGAGAGQEPSSITTAVAWVDAVMDRMDLRAAWELTDPDFRLVLAQHWVLSHGGAEFLGPQAGWDMLAQGLAACPSRHPLWGRFASERLQRWYEFWGDFSTSTWRVHDEVERVPGATIEVVTFVEPAAEGQDGQAGLPGALRRIAVRLRDGRWRVAGLDGRRVFRPGWPPAPA